VEVHIDSWAVVGARVLPEAWASQVAEVVRFFLERGWGVGSGGARGADQFALEAVVAGGARRARGRWCSFRARCLPRPARRFAPSPRSAGAWCLARARRCPPLADVHGELTATLTSP